MNRRTLFSSVVLIGVLLFYSAGEGFTGVIVEQVVRDQNGVPSKTTLYLSDHQYRTDHQEARKTTLLDFKRDRLVMVDHRSKCFVEVKLSLWEREVAKRAKREFPGVQPKRRKILVRRTGKKAVINGFQTEQVEVLAGSELIEENWVTRDVEMKEVEQVLDRVAQGFSKDLREEMREDREIYEKVKPFGFPVLIKDYAVSSGLAAIDRVEVKKIEKKELKGEVFLPPADYLRIIPAPQE